MLNFNSDYYLKDGGHKSAIEKKINLQQQQKELLEQQEKKLLGNKNKIETDIADMQNILTDIDNKQMQVNKNLEEMAIEEAQDPEYDYYNSLQLCRFVIVLKLFAER